MPITGPTDWLSTIDDFIAHWAQANTALGTPIILSGAYTVASLTTARTGLATAMTAYDTSSNDQQTAESSVKGMETIVRQKIGDFNRAVRAFLTTTSYPAALGGVPTDGDAPGRYIKTMDDASSLWVKINSVTLPTFTPPLIIRGGYIQSQFATQVTSLKTAYTTATTAGRNEKVMLEQRNSAFAAVEPRLGEYRKAVIASFAPGSALVLSIPKINPPKGATPDAVQATGLWNAATSKADLHWAASEDEQLAHYSVRMCVGTSFRAADAQVVGTVQPGTLTFSTAAGLVASGDKAVFKIYVVRSTGNEKGSNGVKIVRP